MSFGAQCYPNVLALFWCNLWEEREIGKRNMLKKMRWTVQAREKTNRGVELWGWKGKNRKHVGIVFLLVIWKISFPVGVDEIYGNYVTEFSLHDKSHQEAISTTWFVQKLNPLFVALLSFDVCFLIYIGVGKLDRKIKKGKEVFLFHNAIMWFVIHASIKFQNICLLVKA